MRTNLAPTNAKYMFVVTDTIRSKLQPEKTHYYFFDRYDLKIPYCTYSGLRINTFYKNCRVIIKNYIL